MRNTDKYIKLVEWSEEDQCYVGSIPGFLDECCHGDDEEKVYHELKIILKEWLDIYEKDGIALPSATASKNFSGKFILRVSKNAHKALYVRALQAKTSLNQYCKSILENSLEKRINN